MTRKEAIELLESLKRQMRSGLIPPIEPEALALRYFELREKSAADRD